MSCGKWMLLYCGRKESELIWHCEDGGLGWKCGGVGGEDNALLRPAGLFHVSLFPLIQTPSPHHPTLPTPQCPCFRSIACSKPQSIPCSVALATQRKTNKWAYSSRVGTCDVVCVLVPLGLSVGICKSFTFLTVLLILIQVLVPYSGNLDYLGEPRLEGEELGRGQTGIERALVLGAPGSGGKDGISM